MTIAGDAAAGPTLRGGTPADAEALAALELAVFPHPWTAPQLAHELRLPSALAVVAEAAREVAGFALFRRVLDEAELLRLAVAAPLRRRGLASALVARGLALLQRAGVRSVFLEVRADNAPAIGFYEAAAWKAAGRRARYYPDGVDALLYRREI